MKTKRKQSPQVLKRSVLTLEIIKEYNLRGEKPTTEQIRLELLARDAYERNYGESKKAKLQRDEITEIIHRARDGKIRVNGQEVRVQSMDTTTPTGKKGVPGWKQESLFEVVDFAQTIGKRIEAKNQCCSEIQRLTSLCVSMHGPESQGELPSF